jgi:osmotically-inducible protein OsmY
MGGTLMAFRKKTQLRLRNGLGFNRFYRFANAKAGRCGRRRHAAKEDAMAQDRDWDNHHDDNQASRGAGERTRYGRDDYARDNALYGEAGYRGRQDRFGGRPDEGRSWQGRDRYDGDYGERLYADRAAGGRHRGGHSLEGFARGQSAIGSGFGHRGYGQTGVAQNRNSQGGVGQTGFSQSGAYQDSYGDSSNYYGEENGGRGAYRGYGYRSGGYGGRSEPIGAGTNPYLADITEGEHRGRGPKNYTRSDDRIREDVSDRLSDAADVNASDIEVAVKGAEVTLSGTVDSRRAKRRAEDLADDVSGVKHVQNNLRVAETGETRAMGDTLPRV